MSIYITGDIHGELSRFSDENFKREGICPKPGDMFIVTGDFGIPFIGNGDADFINRDERNLLELSQKPYLFCFCDGTHDNTEYLNTLPDKEWGGGLVNGIAPNVVRLKTGHIFTIEDKNIFVFGGGITSDFDKKLTQEGLGWWQSEEPSDYQFESAVDRLVKHNNTVDYVISHTPPFNADICSNKVTSMLRAVKDNINYKKWFCGCMHVDRYYENDRVQCVYQTFHRLC